MVRANQLWITLLSSLLIPIFRSSFFPFLLVHYSVTRREILQGRKQHDYKSHLMSLAPFSHVATFVLCYRKAKSMAHGAMPPSMLLALLKHLLGSFHSLHKILESFPFDGCTAHKYRMNFYLHSIINLYYYFAKNKTQIII